MKKILNKKVLGVLLAVMMLLSLSAPAFATDTVSVTFKVATGVDHDTFSTIYTVNQPYSSGDTIADVMHAIFPGTSSVWRTNIPVDPVYSPLHNSNSPLYDPDGILPTNPNYIYTADILRSVTINSVPYGTDDYVPEDFEEYDMYEEGYDDLLDYYNDLFMDEYGGLKYYFGDGLFSTWTGGNTMIYIGYAWSYTVGGVTPGISTGNNNDFYEGFYQYYMNEFLASSSPIELTYDHYYYITSF